MLRDGSSWLACLQQVSLYSPHPLLAPTGVVYRDDKSSRDDGTHIKCVGEVQFLTLGFDLNMS